MIFEYHATFAGNDVSKKLWEVQGHYRDKEKWKLHFNIIIRSIKALPVSPEKSPAEISVKAQTHANDWNNHLQSDGVVFVPSLTLLPLSSSTQPHPSSQSLFVLLNHSEFVLCVLKRPSVCLIKEGENRDTYKKCDKLQGNAKKKKHSTVFKPCLGDVNTWLPYCVICLEEYAADKTRSVNFDNFWKSVMCLTFMKCVWTLLPEKCIYTPPTWILIAGYLIMAIVSRLLIAVKVACWYLDILAALPLPILEN